MCMCVYTCILYFFFRIYVLHVYRYMSIANSKYFNVCYLGASKSESIVMSGIPIWKITTSYDCNASGIPL